MLNFMGEKKRLLNIYEPKFAELASLQENTFQETCRLKVENYVTT